MQPNVSEHAPALENAFRTVTKVKAIVTDAVEDGVRTATQAIKHGRHAAEDAIDEARHTVKQNPLQSVGVAFAAGFLAGGLCAFVNRRSRQPKS